LSGSLNPAYITMDSNKGVTATFTEIPPVNVFGKTTIGKTKNVLPVGYVVACRFQAPEDGIATLISAYIHGRYQNGLVKVMIYSDVDGAPGNLLFESEEITLSSIWDWHDFAVNCNIEGGGYYWFAVFASVEMEMRMDAGLKKQQATAWGWTYPNVPSTFNGVYGPKYAAKVSSIYVTYIPSAA
jgi:hypothetical protein